MDRAWSGRPLALLSALLVSSGGCGVLLGLDEYTDAPADTNPGPPSQSTCTDGVLSGDESDVDCGGSCATRCATGRACQVPEDCRGGACEASLCQPSCSDGEQNNEETDVDCGGEACPSCAVGDGCVGDGDCSSGLCDGTSCVEPLVWAKGLGDTSEELLASIAVDSAGGVALHGVFAAFTDLGGGVITAGGGVNVFTVKLDESGQHAWSKGTGSDENQIARAVAVAPADSIVCTGSFSGMMNFGGAALDASGFADLYLAKLSSAGDHMWSENFGSGNGSGSAGAEDIAVDTSGNIFVTGSYTGSLSLGGPNLPPFNGATSGYGEVLVAKFTPSGGHVWSRGFPGGGAQTGLQIEFDGAGNVIVAGNMEGAVDFGGGLLTSSGGSDIFIVKLNSAGNHVWSRRFGDAESQFVSGLAVDGEGNVVVTGLLQGTMDFGGAPMTATGTPDLYIAMLDGSGTHLWSKSYAQESASTVGMRVVASPEGDLVAAGGFSGSVDFGGGVLTSAGGVDVLLLELHASGAHKRSRRFGGSGDQVARTLALSGEHVFLAGDFRESIDFGAGPLASKGMADVFVAKLLAP
ncbi:hypothetical protein [Chondromyces apiculatus]|uniref:hypothetical protein n=1 Tax=Chondromyces apiculatus TaxID=51 RepID=UPI0012DD5540|nr:hypothetical protein [Chondromyces apiculatus]